MGGTKLPDQKGQYHPNGLEMQKHQISMPCISNARVAWSIPFEWSLTVPFTTEGNRAIVFANNQQIPVLELKECIKAALRYHKVKGQLTLGIWI